MKYSSMLKRFFDACIAAVVLYAPMCFYGIFLLNIAKTTGVKWIEDKELLKNRTEDIILYSLLQVFLRMAFAMIPYSNTTTGLLFIVFSFLVELLYWDWKKT